MQPWRIENEGEDCVRRRGRGRRRRTREDCVRRRRRGKRRRTREDCVGERGRGEAKAKEEEEVRIVWGGMGRRESGGEL